MTTVISISQPGGSHRRKSFFVGILAASCCIVSLMLMPNAASAQATRRSQKQWNGNVTGIYYVGYKK
jgi:hypothetical protein